MKRKEPWFSVEIELEFTADEIRILAECSKAHYDGRCKEASKSGFIKDMENFLHFIAPSGIATRYFSWYDCDLAAKITEGGWCLSPEDGIIASDLNRFFHETMTAISSLGREANKV
jgi:hypothetical protein